MVLRNYYNLIMCQSLGYAYTSLDITGDGFLNITTLDGEVRSLYCGGNDCNYPTPCGFGSVTRQCLTNETISTSMSRAGLCIGNGNSAVTYDDYCLSHMITSGWSFSTVKKDATYNSTTKMWERVICFDIQNTSSDEMTITEFGIALPHASSDATSAVRWMLVVREKLTNSITLQPNEIGRLKIKFSCPSP